MAERGARHRPHRYRSALHRGRRRSGSNAHVPRRRARSRCCARCSREICSATSRWCRRSAPNRAVLLAPRRAASTRDCRCIFLDTRKHVPRNAAPIATSSPSGSASPTCASIQPDPERLAASATTTGCAGRTIPTAAARSARSMPLRRRSTGFDASITGRKGFQSATRTALPRFEVDERPAEGQSARRLDQGRSRRLFRGARPAAPSARGAGLSVDRLHAVHQQGAARRGPARRPLARLGQDRVRHPRATRPGADLLSFPAVPAWHRRPLMDQLPVFVNLRGVRAAGRRGRAADAKRRLIEGAGGIVVGEPGAARVWRSSR